MSGICFCIIWVRRGTQLGKPWLDSYSIAPLGIHYYGWMGRLVSALWRTVWSMLTKAQNRKRGLTEPRSAWGIPLLSASFASVHGFTTSIFSAWVLALLCLWGWLRVVDGCGWVLYFLSVLSPVEAPVSLHGQEPQPDSTVPLSLLGINSIGVSKDLVYWMLYKENA